MPRGKSFTLTDKVALGLFFVQRYRFLTIDQFARAGDINRSTASDQLRFMERHGLLSHRQHQTSRTWQNTKSLLFNSKGLGNSPAAKRYSAGADRKL